MSKFLVLLFLATFGLTSCNNKTQHSSDKDLHSDTANKKIEIVKIAPDINNKIGFATSKYQGVYSFGNDAKKEAVGSIIVYPESDSTVLFHLDICKGPPSYNLGELFERLVIKGDSALCFYKDKFDENGCKLKMHFKGNKLIIETVEGFKECGFGVNVYADEMYYRHKKKIPQYFITYEGDTILFKNMTPEKYTPGSIRYTN